MNLNLKLSKYKVILASNSSRRKELLKGIDIEYKVKILNDLDENYPDNLEAEKIPVFLAEKKSKACENILKDDTLLITADTIVLFDDKIYGKPINEKDAKKMLRDFSGNYHKVITGVCIRTKQKTKSFSSVSEVKFSILDEDEINYYIEKYKPIDKAGSYGIQEWIGFIGVESISGSYFNIVGLPIQQLYKELKEF